MRKIIAGLLKVALAVTVAYTGYCAWIAYGAPARVVASYSFAPECQKVTHAGNALAGSQMECQNRIFEAERLRQHPGLATRDGDNLTIFYNGSPISRLVPVQVKHDDSTCNSYEVNRGLTVNDPETRTLRNLAQVACYQGEFSSRFIAMPDGSRWQVHKASVSPGGRLIADGSNSWDAENGRGHLTLYNWPSRQVAARFRPSCRPLAWQDDRHFTVTCMLDTQPVRQPQVPLFHLALATMVVFDARVWQDDKGVWQMQATRWLGGRIQFNADGDMEFPPTFSLRWLPHYRAIS